MRPLLLLVLVALLAGRAATASNAVPGGGAGAGSGIVSGYTVSGISYSLSGETVDGVSFTLDRTGATTVLARLAPTEPWTSCTISGTAVSCPVTAQLASVSALDVVASA
jgi:hypothetical protein